MPSGIGLDTAFNQDPPTQNINTHPKKVKEAESFEKKSSKGDDLERIQHTKVGDIVAYTTGSGVVVSKDGSYLTIYNEESNAYDRMRAGETHMPGDTISSGIITQLWDQMNHETRMASLHKSGIQEPLHFIDRRWSELPMNLKDVLKLSPSSVSVGYGVKSPPAGATQDKKPLTRKQIKERDSPKQTKPVSAKQVTNDKKIKLTPNDMNAAISAGKKIEGDKGLKRIQNMPQSGLDILTAKKPKDEGVTFASDVDKANPTSRGEPGEKMPGTASRKPEGQTMTPTGEKNILIGNTGNKLNTGQSRTFTPGGNKPAPKAKPIPESKRKPVGEDSGRFADAAAARSTNAPGPKKDEGVTFATGLDKSKSYGDIAVAIYRIRNNINKVKQSSSEWNTEPDTKTEQSFTSGQHDTHNTDSRGQIGSSNPFKVGKPGKNDPSQVKPKFNEYDPEHNDLELGLESQQMKKVQSSTPKGLGFGKIEGTGGSPGDKPAVAPPGGTKFFSDSGKGPFGSQKEADASAPRKQRNISAERSAKREYDAKPGQTVANRLSEVKQSDVEHGAPGGVVTDTPFDAPDDYEEKRPKVQGKEFDHNHQQKTPEDIKDRIEKESGAVTTGTPGTNNSLYNEDEKKKSIINKSNTRYGPRLASKEDIERLTK
jgi:hypothetical protein